jgi:hypothetical protein
MGTKFEDIIEYIVAFISEFSNKYELSQTQAYKYLLGYNVIDLIETHYDIVHTLRLEDVIDDMTQYCKRHGGAIG